ncbi:MAG TPA: hypothetical protein VKS20_12305 [Candidatus Acidoferrales bacterium]|nr:hypothetical protein [Candidatus Acidoferrales bacterium]
MDKLWAVIFADVVPPHNPEATAPAQSATPSTAAMRKSDAPQTRIPHFSLKSLPAPPALQKILRRHGALPPRLLRYLLIRASQAQQRRLKWGILPYNITAGSEFMTITANLQRLPRILLDLRGRLQPLLLQIGVGIGALDGHLKQPANRLTGQCVCLARRALSELQSEQRVIEASRVASSAHFGKSSAQSRRRHRARTPKNIPLTRFCTINRDFDETVNEFYRLQDDLVRKMALSQWRTFAVQPPSGESNPQNAAPLVHSASSDPLPGERTSRTTEHVVSLVPPANAAEPSRSASALSRTLQPGYHGQLMAAAAGVEQLIGERFYAALHDED